MTLEQKRVIYGLEGSSLNDVDDQFFDSVWVYTDVGPVWADKTAEAINPTLADITFTSVFAAVGDILYMGKSNIFYAFEVIMSTASTGSTKVLEYWNGSSWVAIPWYFLQYGTLALGTVTPDSNSVIFQPPDDWATYTVNGSGPYYWIRLRITVAATVAGIASTIWCDAYSPTKVLLSAITRGWGFVSIGSVYTDITSGLANIAANPTLTGALGDILYLGSDKMNDCFFIRTTITNTATRTWEYWNGSWTSLADVTAVVGSTNLAGANVDHYIKFTCPEDWTTNSVNGVTLYWIRARVSGAGTSGVIDYMYNGPIFALSKVITISETTSRNFLSVFASLFSSSSRAFSYGLYRVAIKIGSTARSYILDDTVTFTNTGEIANRISMVDFTGYFNSYFGAGTTATVTIYVSAVLVSVGGFHRSINGILEVNYEHDETDNTKTKTVIFALPYNRNDSGYLRSRVWEELMRSAIPQLTGGGEIVENTPTIKNIFFEFKQESASTDGGMQSHWLEFKIDSGGTVLRTFKMVDIEASGVLERIIIDQNSLTTTSTHSIFLRLFELLANNHYYPGISCLMYVTYTYDHGASTSITNFVDLQLDADQVRMIGGTDRNADEFFFKRFDIPEANPVLGHSSLLTSFNANSVVTIGQIINNAIGFFEWIYQYDDSGTAWSSNYATTMQNLISGAISTTGYRDRYDILYIGKSDLFRNINLYLSVASTGAREWSYSAGSGSWTSFHRSFGAVYTWDNSAATFTDDTSAAGSMDTNTDVTWTVRMAAVDDAVYIGDTNIFKWISIFYSTARNATASVVEYWNGAWVSMNDYLQAAIGATNAGNNTAIHQISIVPPTDWATTVINGYTGYFVRIRNVGAVTTGGVANYINSFIDSFYTVTGNAALGSIGAFSARLYSPAGWAQNTVNGQAAYWVRARVVGANMSADQNITELNMFKNHNFASTGRMAQQFLNHRIDQGGTNPLAQGSNTFKFNIFRKGATGVDGYQGYVRFLLVYQSSKHASGDGRHNRTISTLFSQDVAISATGGRVNLTSKSFIAVGTTWFIQDMNFTYLNMASITPSYNWVFVLPTSGEKTAYGFDYDEIESALSYDNIANELRPSYGSFVGFSNYFMTHPNDVCLLNPFTSRSLSLVNVGAIRLNLSGVMTLHKIPKTIGQSIVNTAGSGVGLTVDIFKKGAKKHEHIGSVVSVTGPLYTMPYANSTDTLFAASTEDGTHQARSLDQTAS